MSNLKNRIAYAQSFIFFIKKNRKMVATFPDSGVI